jgi:xylitol oxidase
VPGPWHARLPHFRMEFTPSTGAELQSEYMVSRERAQEAIDAVARVREKVAPVLQVNEIRTVAADDLWLSMNYQRDSLGLHFTWIADTNAVLPAVAALEESLAPLEPRPHWGKVFTMDAATIRERYERFTDFAGLVKGYDPDGKFRNAWLDDLLG